MNENSPPTQPSDVAHKLRAWSGRVVDELAAMGGNTNELRVVAHVVALTSKGIEIVVMVPVKPGESPVEQRIELQWSNFVGSAMALATLVGRGAIS